MTTKEKKPFLVDVPVRVNIWIRPECQKKQFDVLKQARPSILFLQSDGGRNEREWEAIYRNRQLFETEIDWDCTVYKIYEDHNLGLYAMGAKVSTFIWEHTDRCIFLEDDQIPSVSYFRFCAELLERYKDDLRIDCICGVNYFGESKEVQADYFFARHGSIWGTATWKRAYDMRDKQFTYGQDPYTMKLLKEQTKHNPVFMKKIEGFTKDPLYDGHVAGSEFYRGIAMYGYHQLQIIPKVNMISNIGCTEDAAHGDSLKLMPRGMRKVYNMPVYEMEFPMKHTDYIIPDDAYEKKRHRLLGYNYPIIRTYRRVERFVLLLIHGKVLKRLKQKAVNRNRIET